MSSVVDTGWLFAGGHWLGIDIDIGRYRCTGGSRGMFSNGICSSACFHNYLKTMDIVSDFYVTGFQCKVMTVRLDLSLLAL